MIPSKDNASGTLLDHLIKDDTTIQGQIMTSYLQEVKTTVNQKEQSSNFEQSLNLWKTADGKERLRTFDKLFYQRPLNVAYASLCRAAVAVLLLDIFCDITPDHVKWKRYHRSVFCLASEHTFGFRVWGHKDRRTGSDGNFANWKAMTKSEIFEKIDLSDIGDIPVQWSAGLLRVRQPLRLPADTRHDDDNYDFEF